MHKVTEFKSCIKEIKQASAIERMKRFILQPEHLF